MFRLGYYFVFSLYRNLDENSPQIEKESDGRRRRRSRDSGRFLTLYRMKKKSNKVSGSVASKFVISFLLKSH